MLDTSVYHQDSITLSRAPYVAPICVPIHSKLWRPATSLALDCTVISCFQFGSSWRVRGFLFCKADKTSCSSLNCHLAVYWQSRSMDDEQELAAIT